MLTLSNIYSHCYVDNYEIHLRSFSNLTRTGYALFCHASELLLYIYVFQEFQVICILTEINILFQGFKNDKSSVISLIIDHWVEAFIIGNVININKRGTSIQSNISLLFHSMIDVFSAFIVIVSTLSTGR